MKKLLLALSASLFFIINNYAQCVSSYTHKIIEGENKVVVDVSTTDRFDISLFTIDGSGLKLIEKKSGSGNEEIVFENLSKDKNYRIVFTFEADKGDKLCHKRQITYLTL